MVVLPPTIPPSANLANEAIVAITPITAATPAAIAARLAGKGSEAPEAVALAIASPDLAPVAAKDAVVSASEDATLAALAALYTALALCKALLKLLILPISEVILSITPKMVLPMDSITSKALISSKPLLISEILSANPVAAPQLFFIPSYISLLAFLIVAACSLLMMSGVLPSVSILTFIYCSYCVSSFSFSMACLYSLDSTDENSMMAFCLAISFCICFSEPTTASGFTSTKPKVTLICYSYSVSDLICVYILAMASASFGFTRLSDSLTLDSLS